LLTSTTALLLAGGRYCSVAASGKHTDKRHDTSRHQQCSATTVLHVLLAGGTSYC
jgi:hypothetical protein